MLGMEADKKSSGKCYFTHGSLPVEFDLKQPPTTKQPFLAIRSMPYCHTAELILSEEAYTAIREKLMGNIRPAKYATVIMPLSALLEKEFLAIHIKNGSMIMISEGRAGIDDTFVLCDGILRLFLNKETYERSGLVGKPDGSTKTRRAKARWMVEIDLRLPSMQHGKKGFKRVQWAAERVLNRLLRWIFCDLTQNGSAPTPIDRHHPLQKTAEALVTPLPHVVVPGSLSPVAPPNEGLDAVSGEYLDEFAMALYEWLGLVSLESPRIKAQDSVDPFLSRYSVPATEGALTQSLIRIKWNGLLPANWISDLWLRTLFVVLDDTLLPFEMLTFGATSFAVRSSARTQWFALNMSGFEPRFPDGGHGYTILRAPPALESTHILQSQSGQPSNSQFGRDEYLLWEVNGA